MACIGICQKQQDLCELKARTPAAFEACRTTYTKCTFAKCGGSGVNEVAEEATVQDFAMACIGICQKQQDLCELKARSPAAFEACRTTYTKCTFAKCGGSGAEITVEDKPV